MPKPAVSPSIAAPATAARAKRPTTPRRSRTASELLVLEALDVAQRRGWHAHARRLLLERLRQHGAVLRHWQRLHAETGDAGAAAAASGAAVQVDNEALDPAPLETRLGVAIDSARRMAQAERDRRAADGVPTAAETLRDAKAALDEHAKALRTLPEPLRQEIDDDLAEAHRRFVLTGVAQPLWSGTAASRRPEVSDQPDGWHDHALMGLALSGGGVRSASFALGTFQALSRFGLLRAVDFLSAVSGGSWAAGWLAGWAYRHRDGIGGVEDELFASNGADCAPLRWVRRYVSYLAPRAGFTSGDNWQLLVAYIANSLPILALVSLSLLCLLLLPHLLSAAAAALLQRENFEALAATGCVALGLLLVLMTLLRRLTLYYREPGERPRESGWLAWLVSATTLAATLLLAATAPLFALVVDADGLRLPVRWPFGAHPTVSVPLTVTLLWVGATGLSVALAWLLTTPPGEWLSGMARRLVGEGNVASGVLRRHPGALWQEAAAVAASVTLAAVFTWLLLPLDATVLRSGPLRIAYGPFAVMAVFATAELFGSILTSRQDVHRAWSARLGGWILATLVSWTVLCTLALGVTALWRDATYSPYAIAAWVMLIAGVLLYVRRSVAGARDRRQAMLLAGGLAVLGTVLLLFAGHLARDDDGALRNVETLAQTFGLVLIALLTMALLCNVNRYSLHAIYKQGLVRTFLGASRLDMRNTAVAPHGDVEEGDSEARQFRRRRPQPPTDLDDDDNTALKRLLSRPNRQMPVLLFNAAVNGISPTDLKGRAPRQWPFTFSQRYCGSPAAGIGYAPTRAFYAEAKGDGLSLGGAMAVSGAAVSPTAGATTRPLRAFMLGVLNARLGMWIGNPNDPDGAVRRASPPLGGFTVLREMLGLRARFGAWIHLSDGGHFENLGVYELVRRGCSRIVAVDASCDPAFDFNDLADAIRRARIDLGVQIYPRDGWWIQAPTASTRRRGRNWMWFEIDYGPNLPRGRLLYVKSSVYQHQKLPAEVLSYWRQAPEFPHEGTSNQFFSEQQMEAYRSLGNNCMIEALAAVWGDATPEHPDRDPRLQTLLRRSA